MWNMKRVTVIPVAGGAWERCLRIWKNGLKRLGSK